MQGPSADGDDGQGPADMQCDASDTQSGMIPRVLTYLFSKIEEEKASAAAEGAAFEFSCRREPPAALRRAREGSREGSREAALPSVRRSRALVLGE